jgi:hypothetical protein
MDLVMILITGASGNLGREVLGRKPISFAQFSRDYKQAFQAQERAAS